MSQDAEAKRDHAPPEEYTAQWLLPVAAAVLGVLLISGFPVVGFTLLVCGVGVGVWMSRQTSAATDARALWDRSLVCLGCRAVFPREDAAAV